MFRDKLIQGLLDKALQERLTREISKKARALQEVVSECKTAERTVSDNRVPILGECYLNCETKRYRKTYKFLVTSLNSCPILGLEACRELGLIQRLNMIYKSPIETPELILKEFADVFTAGPHKVPLAIHNKVKEELSNMVEAGIISKVEEPKELVSDGGPPYNSNLMMNFFREWGIEHHVTPPHFPRANGQIETSANSKKLSY
ncbi:uncharacterized protein TNIN_152411 [Trichonephila inaurata madagascariensis]|uniref:Integrase catalytic domain-containing protein n=1 Tax=Trichonephila inaurata madagascariensis TaxID=2747483 RepID=A0A8X6YE48_9ARAC|nr:uncharacterized protein TNIN_152411 [Trichonephila inaurata madagascariensis]